MSDHALTPEAILQMREAMATQGKALPAPVVATADYQAEEVPVRLYRPEKQADSALGRRPLLVFLHGGGWFLGNLETHDACCRWLCTTAGCAVLAVGYRLAPEHPFPAALNDAHIAFRWSRQNASMMGCDADRIAIGGESAGANLAAALTQMLRDQGEEQPLFQLLVHPPTDLRLMQPSIDEVQAPGLTRASLEACVSCYIGDRARDDPFVSPLRARTLESLAPALVVTVEHDPLRDDGEQYALALARAGNEVSLQRLPGLAHGFMFLPATMPEIEHSYRVIGSRVARYFALQP